MWLVKTEPGDYGYPDLEREGRTTWNGVKNPVARKHLAAMKKGDRVIVYHTGDEKAAVGLARVSRAAYPDPGSGDPRAIVIDLEAGERLPRPVPLSEMKAHPAFAESPLVRQGRLSVLPLTSEQWAILAGPGKR